MVESSLSRDYFEKFRKERDEKLEAMKKKEKTYRRVNIDEAVLGNTYN